MDTRFTDKFFKIPVLQYSRFDMDKADEEEENQGIPVPLTGAVGKMAINPYDILSYHEGFARGTHIQDVIDNGFDLTTILTKEDGYISCIWPIKEFEEKLNEFMIKYDRNDASI